MKLLVLSNGHGEDAIAIRIIERLQSDIPELEIVALPIVGQGYAYKKLDIPLAGRVQQMPSGGFIYKGGNPLWQDLRGGLVQLTIEQFRLIRQWGKTGGKILAVGDIVPLLYAWRSKADYAFVGTAKSEYYLRDEFGWLPQTSRTERQFDSVYLPWERWLMSHYRCRAVFPRDSLTTEVLQRWDIPAYDLGNPMMDGITTKTEARQESQLNVLLLPGSRMPEAINNWQQILLSVWWTIKALPKTQVEFKAAIAPGIDLKPFVVHATTQGWRIFVSDSKTIVLKDNHQTLTLTQEHNQAYFHEADIAIAMAGTATEQFVGLGKPVVIFPGIGPQFTPAFAEAQSRLLGCSIVMVDEPTEVGKAIAKVIQDEQLLEQISVNGKRRMGEAGAAQRITECLQTNLLAPDISKFDA
ncbi:MAG: lipid-A-disaccharide synthase-related protein [Cyanobacteria bacterium J06600_6]